MIFADDQSTFSLGPNALLVSKGLRKSMIFADRPIKRTTCEKDFVPKKITWGSQMDNCSRTFLLADICSRKNKPRL